MSLRSCVAFMKFRKLIFPTIVSCAPWALFALLPFNSRPADEGGLFAVGFLSMLLFSIAGPLAGAVLGERLQSFPVDLVTFVLSFYLVTLPMLAFQTFALGTSMAPVFLRLIVVNGQSLTTGTSSTLMILSGLLVGGLYGLQAIIMYVLARWFKRWIKIGAFLLFVVTITSVIRAIV